MIICAVEPIWFTEKNNHGGEETIKNEQDAQHKHLNNQPNSSSELSTK
jgi:hypothetical protein